MGRALLVAGTIEELLSRVDECEKNKKEIIRYIHSLKEKYLDREISYLEYEEVLEKKFNGKTLHEWLDFYEDYAKKCGKKVRDYKKKKIKRKILTIFYALFVLFLLSALAYYGNKTLVGFVIKEAEVYTQTLNLEFNETQNFEFIPEGIGILNSIKLSGIIEGEGEIKIYLDDLLILDSNALNSEKSKTSLITGFVIENSESFSEENLTQEAPQIQEESPSQEEPLASENITANQTETTEPIAETQAEKEIIIKEFSDICEETCDLKSLNLNKSSYILKIEISNAKLKLEKISYELVPEIAEIIPEIPINITPEINITETNATISIQQIEINKPVKWKSEIKAKTLEEAEEKISKTGKIKSSRILDNELFEVEYETPAPMSYEKEISRTRKEITISAPAELNYTNVLSYTQLTAEARPGKIKLYHITSGKSELVNITTYDKNNNNLIDYVEWISPTSNNETYELIIEISAAEHLDENKNFISDIYEQVSNLDDIWSEQINSNEYVRVTFRQNLTSKNDITLYPRIVSGNPTIQVYEKDKSELIAEFFDLISNKYNKVLLTNLKNSQDNFDLKILRGSIELNHIIDPDILRINATTASYGSTDITDTACDAGSLDVDDSVYCGQSMSIEGGEAGYINSTHTYPIPSTATITSAWICAKTDISAKLDDNAADNVTIYVAENQSSGTGAWKYYAVNSCQSTGCTAWETETLTCYNVISIINNPTRASAVQISARAYQGDADANQYVRSNLRYVNLSYTTPDSTPPNISIIYPINTTYDSPVIQLNYTISGDATSCMYYNGTINGSITCGDNLTMIASEGSSTWIVYANDSTQNINTSIITFIQDTQFPIFINYYDSNSTYSGEYANFSVNITSTNATVGIELNGTNYTASNNTYLVFNFSINLTTTGNYPYYWLAWGNGTLYRYNVSVIRYYTVNSPPTLTPPNLTIIKPENTTYNTVVNQLNYSVAGADFCMYFNGTANATITCGENITIVGAEGANIFGVYANNTKDYTNSTFITFIVDTQYPVFYNYSDNNATVTGSGLGNFSVNINSTNGTVFLDINGANYTASNVSTGNLFNVSVNLNTGVYAYYWLSYGNGTLSRYNVSAIRYYTVNASANTAPQIRNIWNNTLIGTAGDGIDPIENGTSFVQFNITVYDENEATDLNDNSIKANFTRASETIRENLTCSWIADFDTYYANYSCTIDMWYFDEAGDWNITVYIEDNAAESALNSTTTFSYKQLKALVIAPNSLTWPSVTPGNTNKTSNNDPTIINNTGNYNATGKINITAINLYGAIDAAEFISAGNFSAGIATGGAACSGDACTECKGTFLQNGTSKNITGTILNRGNLSIGAGTAQEELYYCMVDVPYGISTQNFDTTYSKTGGWTIVLEIIFLVTTDLNKKKRKKKTKTITEENILDILENKLREKYKIDLDELIIARKKEIEDKEIEIPLDIFRQKISPSEALAKYLKENKNLKFSEISRLLNRNQRTIWINYRNAKRKNREKLKITKESVLIPIEVFSNRKLSILESLTYYLKTIGLKNSEIAGLIEKDSRNIYTIYSRIVKKLERKV